jgi:hypothetical protein
MTIAIVGFISLAALAAGTLVDLPDVAAVLERVTGALGPWTYAVVAVLVFLETVALAGYAFADSLGRHVEAAGNVALAVIGAAAITYSLRRRCAPSTRTQLA